MLFIHIKIIVALSSGDNPYKVDSQQINDRGSLLQRYLCDEEKELQALYALQALMVHMEQPASECPTPYVHKWFRAWEKVAATHVCSAVYISSACQFWNKTFFY